jgi:diguanylate cyclase
VRKESLTDPLTGIGNRRALDGAIERALRRFADKAEDASLLLCDIDHFKTFNDNWGHQTGDQVLRLVAKCLSDNVKGRDTAARYGGEEFAVLLRGAKIAEAILVAEQIRLAVESNRLIKKSTGTVLGTITVSVGVIQFAPDDTAETVIHRVDACLYGAKQNGRNLVLAEDDPRMARLNTSAA